jgi:autotransporter strand-loop-strand O-heptosyltransferase
MSNHQLTNILPSNSVNPEMKNTPAAFPRSVHTQAVFEGSLGIRYDFNDGARLWLPEGVWYVELSDADTGNILFASHVSGGWVQSSKKYYVRFKWSVWCTKIDKKLVFHHVLDLKGRDVYIHCSVNTLGDTLAWFPMIEEFRKKHDCIIYYNVADYLACLFQNSYPHWNRVSVEVSSHKSWYATYHLSLFFNDHSYEHQPFDYHSFGLHQSAAHILGLNLSWAIRPKLLLNAPRQIKEPYVCIAVQATSQCKKWNNPSGWDDVVRALKSKGYRVLCIDKDHTHGADPIWTSKPKDAEDWTGNHSLMDRVALLQHADAFIGLSSGLSWLAWACRIPVVLISGFTLPLNEFKTPHRVFNVHTCNGCWNDVRHQFDHFDFFWCPRHRGTSREFECSRLITSQDVLNHVDSALKQSKKLQNGQKKLDSKKVNISQESIR